MKILEIKVLKGPNYWSVRRTKLIQMKLDLEEMEQRPTDAIPGFRARLEKTFPTIHEVYARRLALEETIASDVTKLDAAIRSQMLMDAFDLAEPHFAGGYGHEGRRILSLVLRPLWPSEEEIRGCLEICRKRRSRMGRQLRTVEVMDSIYPDSKPANRERFDY